MFTVSPVFVFGPDPRFITCCVPGTAAYRELKLLVIFVNACLNVSPFLSASFTPKFINSGF